MNISNKLLIAFGAFTAAVVAGAIVVGLFVRDLDRAAREVTGHAIPISESAHEMEINAVETGLAVMKYLRRPDPAFRERLADGRADFEKALADFRARARTEEKRRLADEVEAEYRKIFESGLATIDNRDAKLASLGDFTRTLGRIDSWIEEKLKAAAPAAAVTISEMHAELGELSFKLIAKITLDVETADHDVAEDLRELHALAEHLRSDPAFGDAARRNNVAPELETLESQAKEIIRKHEAIDRGVAEFIGARQRIDVLLDEEI